MLAGGLERVSGTSDSSLALWAMEHLTVPSQGPKFLATYVSALGESEWESAGD